MAARDPAPRLRIPRELWSAHDLGQPTAPPRPRERPTPYRRGRGRGGSPASEAAADPTLPLGLSELWDLRRLGLFDDDGRTPPGGWDQ